MMVIERVELPITPEREAEFEIQFGAAGALLRSAAGCRSVVLARGVESPSTYLLLIEWDSIEAHRTFTSTDAMVRFRAIIGPFLSGKPGMQHFAPCMP